MPISILRQPPLESTYIDVRTFQSSTPESFSTPVLHSLQRDCRVLISAEHAQLLPTFSGSDTVEEASELTVEGVDVWISNENLILFNTKTSTGTEIPYISLTLHAIQRTGDLVGVYMQIALSPNVSSSSNNEDYDDDELIELNVVAKPTAEPTAQSEAANEIFKALSTCASLHPDIDEGEGSGSDENRILLENNGDESRLEGFPGQGDWITAENVDQFRFEDADDGPPGIILGPGAGVVRSLEDTTDQDDGTTAQTETKWRRTG